MTLGKSAQAVWLSTVSGSVSSNSSYCWSLWPCRQLTRNKPPALFWIHRAQAASRRRPSSTNTWRVSLSANHRTTPSECRTTATVAMVTPTKAVRSTNARAPTKVTETVWRVELKIWIVGSVPDLCYSSQNLDLRSEFSPCFWGIGLRLAISI